MSKKTKITIDATEKNGIATIKVSIKRNAEPVENRECEISFEEIKIAESVFEKIKTLVGI